MPKNNKSIETTEEYENAMRRIVKLDTSMPGSPEEDELRWLLMAVEKWEHDHGGVRSGSRANARYHH